MHPNPTGCHWRLVRQCCYTDGRHWQPPASDTPGQPNTDQTFDGCGGITDCNGNGIDDAEDISMGTSQDCDGDGVPDECQSDTDGTV